VTTYPVTIQLDIPEGVTIKAGMNASGTIVTGASENTLTIPVAALQEAGGEKFVMILSNGSAAGETERTEASGAISGERRVVETGISNENRVEILSGLAEGETVSYVEIVSADPDDTSAFMMGGNMSFGGEMPNGMTFSGERPGGMTFSSNGGMGGPPQ
jgi:multidrug efflux pump subunit AcrA (membrane-fusion protein)